MAFEYCKRLDQNYCSINAMENEVGSSVAAEISSNAIEAKLTMTHNRAVCACVCVANETRRHEMFPLFLCLPFTHCVTVLMKMNKN